MLSSPAGNLEPRRLVGLLALAFGIRSAGRLFLQDPVRTYGCLECPANPFAVWPDRAAFETVEVASNLAIGALIALAGLVVTRRLVRAGPALRRARWPILFAGGIALTAGAFDAFEYAWTTATGFAPLEVAAPWDGVVEWGLFVARVLVPVAVLGATLRLRATGGPVGSFAADLKGTRAGEGLGDALRRALGDPTLALLRADETGGWRAEDGAAVRLPGPGGDRAVTLVGDGASPVAAIAHDPALHDQPELLAGVVRVLGLALENERLEADLRVQLEAVRDSRQRIVSAAEEERRRLERDLHDGAQQRLVGVMLALQDARGSVAAGGTPEAIRDRLDAAAREASETMRELRELARGIHPAILEDEGLPAAINALARRAPIPVDIRLSLDGRLPRVVETTAYFTIAEALTNVGRHAGASHAIVEVGQSGSCVGRSRA